MTSSRCLSDSSSAGRKKPLALDFVAGYVIPQKLQLLLIHQLLQQQPSSVSPPPLMRCGPWVGPIVAKQKPVIAECHCCLCSVFLKGISGPSQKALPGCRDCSNIYTSSCPQMPAAPPLLHSGSEPSTCCCHSFHLTWIRLLIPHDELQNVCKHHNIDSVPLFFFF